MGRPSNQDRLDQAQGWAEVVKTSMEAATGTAKFLTEEGLWMGMSIDIFMITGEVHPENEFLFLQREALITMFRSMETMATTEIPIIKDVNPINMIYQFIKPLAKAAEVKIVTGKETKTTVGWGTVEIPHFELPFGIDYKILGGFFGPVEIPIPGTTKTVHYDYYYPALPIQYRILLALLVPGILRLIFNFLSSQLQGGSAFAKLL